MCVRLLLTETSSATNRKLAMEIIPKKHIWPQYPRVVGNELVYRKKPYKLYCLYENLASKIGWNGFRICSRLLNSFPRR